MIFLNPWALILIAVVVWIFRGLIMSKKIQTRLQLLSLILLIVTLARPAITNEITQEKFDANEYILAIDASYSMQMDDIKPSRFEIAKETILSLLTLDTQDRFTLYAFTANPLLISPPTTDTAIVKSALNALEPKYILTKSTSLDSLIQQVATLDQEHKSLIVFTDGGDEHNLASLLTIAKTAAITLNFIGVASSKGTVITKDGKAFKDQKSHLVISRLNPILKELANKSGGFYFELDSANKDISKSIYDKMQEQNLDAKELKSDVISYKELYYVPLIFAFVILLISLTKVQNYLSALLLIFILLPNIKLEASLLDFYYLDVAKDAYQKGNYLKAQNYFKRLEPSQYSYMSLANSYYKNKQYRLSLKYYSQIKSKNPQIKSTVFYNMANAAFRLKKYSRSAKLYQQSLNLHYTQEAYENLLTLYKQKKVAKVDVADMLPTENSKKVKNSTKKIDNQNDDKETGTASSSSKSRDAQGTQGAAGSKSKEKKKNAATIKGEKNKFKMGYNAYELINKGYVNEKNPW